MQYVFPISAQHIMSRKIPFRCNQTSFVGKAEFDAETVISCPLPRCAHLWCKICSQVVELTGPPRSCDGAMELTYLMNSKAGSTVQVGSGYAK